MKLRQVMSTFHPASFEPKAVRRREVTRSLLAALLVFALISLVAIGILIDSLGGRVFAR